MFVIFLSPINLRWTTNQFSMNLNGNEFYKSGSLVCTIVLKQWTVG